MDLNFDSPHDEEAALEALRVAISHDHFNNNNDNNSDNVNDDIEPTLLTTAEVTQQNLERNMAALNSLVNSNQQLVDNLNLPGILLGLNGSLKLLLESNKRQNEIVRNIVTGMNPACE